MPVRAKDVKEEDIVILKTKINGKFIKIKNKLTWGELREMAKVGNVNGVFNPLNALDKMIELVVVDGLNVLDRTNMMKVDAEEFTSMIGEIQKIIPLEKYLKNLNIDGQMFNPP